MINKEHSQQASELNGPYDIESKLKKSPIAGIQDLYENHRNEIERVTDSSFYYYTNSDKQIDEKNDPIMSWRTIQTFYGPAVPQSNGFHRAQEALKNVGKIYAEKDKLETDDLIVANAAFVDPVYDLVRGLRTLNATVATPIKDLQRQPGLIRVLTHQFMNGIGREKPEEFRETLRRYIPRWMTHPIPLPEHLTDEDCEEVGEKWSGFNSKDASYLIHPDKISEGAPLHMVFKIASDFEKQERHDLGYQIRTWGVSKILEMEQERADYPDQPEIPFFKYIMAGSTAGYSLSLAKNVFFDYVSAVNHTIRLTHERVQKELEAGEDGVGMHFLSQLEKMYPENFPELYASSIVNHALKTRHINEIAIVKGLKKRSVPWHKEMLDKLIEFPARRVLTNVEIDEVVRNMPPIAVESKQQDFEENAKEIMGDEDSYSMALVMDKTIMKKLAQGNHASAIKVDLEGVSETIDVQVIYVGDKKVKFIPFSMSFSGDIETMLFETLDEGRPQSETLETLKIMVAEVLQRQVEKNRPKEKRETNPPVTMQPDVVVSVPRLTRKERMERYALQKEQEAQARKRKTVDSMVVPEDIPTREMQSTQEEKTINKKLIGLTYENVIAMMEEERIVGIEPERVVKKVEHLFELANNSGKMVGKRINTNALSESELRGEQINLRQINWILDGGVTQIRIYVEDIKDGKFIFRGIMDKEDARQQMRFIRKLLLGIVRERKEQFDN